MQPAQSIPPYTEANVKLLVGCWVTLHGPRKRWKNWKHGKIKEVIYCNPNSVIVLYETHFGTVYKAALSDCRFKSHCDDPLLVAIHRARLEPQPVTS